MSSPRDDVGARHQKVGQSEIPEDKSSEDADQAGPSQGAEPAAGRRWSQEPDGWWRCDLEAGAWSWLGFQFTERRNEELRAGSLRLLPDVDHPDDDDATEQRLLELLSHATGLHVNYAHGVGEGPMKKFVKVFKVAEKPAPALEDLQIFASEAWIDRRPEAVSSVVNSAVLEAMKSGKLMGLKSLYLELSDFTYINMQTLAHVMKGALLPALSRISLRNRMELFDTVDLAREYHEALADPMSKLAACVIDVYAKQLRTLSLFSFKLSGAGHLELSTVMQSDHLLARLETLDLSQTDIGDDGCEHYEKALSSGRLPALTEMHIGINHIRDRGAEALGRAFESGQTKSLTTLELAFNDIGDVGMIALATSFERGGLPNLKKLDLKGNEFAKKGLLALSRALASGGLNSLEVLDLQSNFRNSRIETKRCAQALVQAFSSNNLLTVDVDFPWYMFPELDLVRKQLLEGNRKNAEICAKLGPQVPATFSKVYVCGNEEVGKTTLTKSIQRGFWEALCTRERRLHDEERTRGIDVSRLISEGKSDETSLELAIWDMAGQDEYHLVHNSFFPDLAFGEGKATTFVVVCKSGNEDEVVKVQLKYWFRFIASSCQKDIHRPRHVLVVLNRINKDKKVLKNAHQWKEWLEHEKGRFQGILQIQVNPFIVDVRKSRFVKGLKGFLIEHARRMLGNEQVPEICEFIHNHLSVWSEDRKQFPILQWVEFVKKVEMTNTQWPENTLEAAAKYLNEAGVIIYIDKKFPREWGVPDTRLLVLDPSWFCKEVVGNIFLPVSMSISGKDHFISHVDKHTGSISIFDFKKFFKSHLGFEWGASQCDELISILLWLGVCYKGKEDNVFIPALIPEARTPGDWWGPNATLGHGGGQWVMGYCIEHQQSEIALAPIALWHRFQVELAQTRAINGQAPDNDFAVGKYYITFKVNYMAVLIEVNANQNHPTFDGIDILVKPLRGVDHDDLDSRTRKQCQVDLASNLVETLLKLWIQVCPGVAYVERVVWPWPASQSRLRDMPERNVEVEDVKRWVQEHGLRRTMHWRVGSDEIIEDQLLSLRHKQYLIESGQGSIRIIRQGLREAVDLGIFPSAVLSKEGSSQATTSKEVKVHLNPQNDDQDFVLKTIQKLVVPRLDDIRDQGDKILNLTIKVLKNLEEVMRTQKSLLCKVQDVGRIFLEDRERSCPRFIYLADRNSSAWIKLKDAMAPSLKVHVHFLCEAKYSDYGLHLVKDQQGLDVSELKEWASKILPWLKVSLTVLYIVAKVAANGVAPGLGLVIPSFVDWQQTSSLSEGIALATGFTQEELGKHVKGAMGLGARGTSKNPEELYGDSRKAMTQLLDKLTTQDYKEKLGLRKVHLNYADGSSHGIAWICNDCYKEFRSAGRSELVSDL